MIMNILEAKQALDKVIAKARVHLYKPIQIAEILYRDRVEGDIDLLDKDVEILCVSEYWKPFNRGGVDGRVVDYSISVVGPSEITVKMLAHAKNRGHKP